ncbi:chorismate--pyruvate lyase family protein [Oceanisphaera sp. W20_SRM_FM3]|uniref:chorismate--pyruvate lyase family protein n=1 Tax=Oceanisphaera sp. W20_SRM_FM3 TaxID=3240267 RepID=UPI003F99D098
MKITADAHWRWQSAVPLALPSLNDWLQDTGSLTARLRLHCKQFRVQLLSTQGVSLTQSQAHWLGETHAYCREVLLLCDEQPWVYASSLYSSAALEALPALGGLGQKALGELLFEHPQLVRSRFEFAQLTAAESQQLVLQVHPHLPASTTSSPWARRSVLAIPEARVLVSELFCLPPAFTRE